MFVDGPMVTKTCPVLAFTGEVEYVLQWFSWCYAVEVVGMGSITCRRVALPSAGSVGEQDAWLWLRLQAMQATMQTILHEQAEQREKRLQGERDARRGR